MTDKTDVEKPYVCNDCGKRIDDFPLPVEERGVLCKECWDKPEPTAVEKRSQEAGQGTEASLSSSGDTETRLEEIESRTLRGRAAFPVDANWLISQVRKLQEENTTLNKCLADNARVEATKEQYE